MIIANVRVNLSSAETRSCAKIPKNAVGLKVRFQYDDPLWNKLSKTAVFRNGTRTVNSILTDNCAIIPSELLNKTKDTIYVGLYGIDSNRALAIPTVWAKLGEVSSAANPSSSIAAVATLPYWAQIKEKVDSLEEEMIVRGELDYALQQAKESGVFDGPQGPKGEPGEPGAAGPAGYTPVAGVDYWTAEDKQTITAEAADIAANVLQHSSDIIRTATGSTLYLNDTSNRKLHSLKLYGKTIQNSTPTPDAPVPLESVGSDGSVDVTVCGNNLLNYDAWKQVNVIHGTATFEHNGVVLTATANDCYTNYTAPGFPEDAKILVSAGESVTISWEESTNLEGHVYVFPNGTGENVGMARNSQTKKLTYKVPSGVTFLTFRFGVASSNTTIAYKNIQIEKGSTVTSYKPNHVQSLSVHTPNGLFGIPVSSGGNYTDNNKQMWVCDEIDFAKGKYVQRIKSLTINSNLVASETDTAGIIRVFATDLVGLANSKTPAISNILPRSTDSWDYSKYGNSFSIADDGCIFFCYDTFATLEEWTAKLAETPINMLYQLATPIETDLTAEEIALYSALHTNHPNTTIRNDAGAHMNVDYWADIGLYIDKRIRELTNT